MQIKVPEIGESIHEAFLAKWFKHNGDHVVRDDVLCELETDKITLEINAEGDGQLNVLVAEGTTVKVGTVIAEITDSKDISPEAPPEESVTAGSPPHEETIRASVSSPAARREMRAGGISPDSVTGTGKGGRITLEDLFTRIEESSRRPVEAVAPGEKRSVPHLESSVVSPVEGAPVVQEKSVPAASTAARQSAEAASLLPPATGEQTVSPAGEHPNPGERRDERIPLSPIRRKIAERLLAARQQTAMLTTFNEADLSQIKRLRENFREHFQQKYGIRLGYMPFFVKACVAALKEYPVLNASIDGGDIVHHRYYDIGIAIGAEKGLVVPILRDADQLRIYQIDQQIGEFGEKIRTNRLAISDLEGGTFSITNGGVYGSMLSTPILNPPQSAILGMHAIQDRPVVRDGQIVIRPMMYLALTYDHRLIDGREAVQFLAKVREYLETPEELLLEG